MRSRPVPEETNHAPPMGTRGGVGRLSCLQPVKAWTCWHNRGRNFQFAATTFVNPRTGPQMLRMARTITPTDKRP